MKEYSLPTVMVKTEKKILKHGMTTIGIIKFDKMQIQGESKGEKRIARFYSRFEGSFERFQKQNFEKLALDAYQNNSSPRKRFRYSPLELEYMVEHSFGENNVLRVDIVISLKQNKNILSQKRITHIWDTKNSNLIIKKQRKQRSAKP